MHNAIGYFIYGGRCLLHESLIKCQSGIVEADYQSNAVILNNRSTMSLGGELGKYR